MENIDLGTSNTFNEQTLEQIENEINRLWEKFENLSDFLFKLMGELNSNNGLYPKTPASSFYLELQNTIVGFMLNYCDSNNMFLEKERKEADKNKQSEVKEEKENDEIDLDVDVVSINLTLDIFSPQLLYRLGILSRYASQLDFSLICFEHGIINLQKIISFENKEMLLLQYRFEKGITAFRLYNVPLLQECYYSLCNTRKIEDSQSVQILKALGTSLVCESNNPINRQCLYNLHELGLQPDLLFNLTPYTNISLIRPGLWLQFYHLCESHQNTLESSSYPHRVAVAAQATHFMPQSLILDKECRFNTGIPLDTLNSLSPDAKIVDSEWQECFAKEKQKARLEYKKLVEKFQHKLNLQESQYKQELEKSKQHEKKIMIVFSYLQHDHEHLIQRYNDLVKQMNSNVDTNPNSLSELPKVTLSTNKKTNKRTHNFIYSSTNKNPNINDNNTNFISKFYQNYKQKNQNRIQNNKVESDNNNNNLKQKERANGKEDENKNDEEILYQINSEEEKEEEFFKNYKRLRKEKKKYVGFQEVQNYSESESELQHIIQNKEIESNLQEKEEEKQEEGEENEKESKENKNKTIKQIQNQNIYENQTSTTLNKTNNTISASSLLLRKSSRRLDQLCNIAASN